MALNLDECYTFVINNKMSISDKAKAGFRFVDSEGREIRKEELFKECASNTVFRVRTIGKNQKRKFTRRGHPTASQIEQSCKLGRIGTEVIDKMTSFQSKEEDCLNKFLKTEGYLLDDDISIRIKKKLDTGLDVYGSSSNFARNRILNLEHLKSIPNIFDFNNESSHYSNYDGNTTRTSKKRKRQEKASEVQVNMQQLLALPCGIKVEEFNLAEFENFRKKLPDYLLSVKDFLDMDFTAEFNLRYQKLFDEKNIQGHFLCRDIKVLYYLILDRLEKISALELIIDVLDIEKDFKSELERNFPNETNKLPLYRISMKLLKMQMNTLYTSFVLKIQSLRGLESNYNESIVKNMLDLLPQLYYFQNKKARTEEDIDLTAVEFVEKLQNTEYRMLKRKLSKAPLCVCGNDKEEEILYTNDGFMCKICKQETYNVMEEVNWRDRVQVKSTKRNVRATIPKELRNLKITAEIEAATANMFSRLREYQGVARKCKLTTFEEDQFPFIEKNYWKIKNKYPQIRSVDVISFILSNSIYFSSSLHKKKTVIICKILGLKKPVLSSGLRQIFKNVYSRLFNHYKKFVNDKQSMPRSNFIYPTILTLILDEKPFYEHEIKYILNFFPKMKGEKRSFDIFFEDLLTFIEKKGCYCNLFDS